MPSYTERLVIKATQPSILEWVNKIFIFLNIFASCMVVYVYATSRSIGSELTLSIFGDGAPLMGSRLLDILVGYPQAFVITIFCIFLAKITIYAKNEKAKFVYNLCFGFMVIGLASLFITLFYLPLYQLGTVT